MRSEGRVHSAALHLNLPYLLSLTSRVWPDALAGADGSVGLEERQDEGRQRSKLCAMPLNKTDTVTDNRHPANRASKFFIFHFVLQLCLAFFFGIIYSYTFSIPGPCPLFGHTVTTRREKNNSRLERDRN